MTRNAMLGGSPVMHDLPQEQPWYRQPGYRPGNFMLDAAAKFIGQPIADAYTGMSQALGYAQDPNAPEGYVSYEALNKGAQGLAEGALVGSAFGRAMPSPFSVDGNLARRLDRQPGKSALSSTELPWGRVPWHEDGMRHSTQPLASSAHPTTVKFAKQPYGITEHSTPAPSNYDVSSAYESRNWFHDDAHKKRWMSSRRAKYGTDRTSIQKRAEEIGDKLREQRARNGVADGRDEDALRDIQEYLDNLGPDLSVVNANNKNAYGASVALNMSRDARLQRAREMGFDTDTVWYHGTDADFAKFDPSKSGLGVHAGTAKAANDRMQTNAMGDVRANAKVLPLHIRDGRYLRVKDALKWEPSDVVTYAREADPNLNLSKNWFGEFTSKSIAKQIRKQGYDGLEYVNIAEDPGSVSRIVFDPTNIRSVNAAFDPAKASSANLLASNPFTGGFAPTYAAPSDDDPPNRMLRRMY